MYEPFAGSGSTLLACGRLARRSRAIEIDLRYCDVVLGRWERFSDQAAVRLERLDAAA